jgi:hypothetical protein
VAEQNAMIKGEYSPEFKNWLTWAIAIADWYDPLINKPDEY